MTTPAVTDGQSAPASGEVASAEPQTPATEQAQEYEWTGNRDDLGRFAAEGYENAQSERQIQTLVAKGEITLADLRTLPEAQGLSDEQLQKM